MFTFICSYKRDKGCVCGGGGGGGGGGGWVGIGVQVGKETLYVHGGAT